MVAKKRNINSSGEGTALTALMDSQQLAKFGAEQMASFLRFFQHISVCKQCGCNTAALARLGAKFAEAGEYRFRRELNNCAEKIRQLNGSSDE